MGGIWERVIRSIKRVLSAICSEQALTDDVLLTLFAEAEHIVRLYYFLQSSDCIISSNRPNRPTLLFPPIVRLYYFVQSSKSSDCIISSNHPNRPTVLFSSIQLISSDHLISSITSVHLNFVRPYYFRLSYLPVQFSSSYFALFLYLNTNLI